MATHIELSNRDEITFSERPGSPVCQPALQAATDSAHLWQHALPAGQQLARTPLYHNGSLILNVCQQDANSSFLQLLDIQNRSLLWSAALPGDSFLSLCILADTLVAQTQSGTLRVYRLLNGELLWKRLQDVDASLTVIEGNLHFVTRDGAITCINADGDIVWQVRTGQQAIHPTAVMKYRGLYWAAMNGWLFAAASVHQTVAAECWLGSQIYGPLTADHQFVYCTTGERKLYAVDPVNSTVAWDWQAAGQLTAPQIYAGSLYVASADGLFHAFDTVKQKPAWQVHIGLNAELNLMFVVDGIAYVTSRENQQGTLYAIDLPTRDENVVSADLGEMGTPAGVESGVSTMRPTAGMPWRRTVWAAFCTSSSAKAS